MKLALLPLLFAQFVFVGGNGQPGYSAAPPAAPAHVQSCGAQPSGAQTVASCTLPSSIAAGHLLYVCVTSFDGQSLSDIVLSGDGGAFVTELPDTVWSSAGGAQSWHSICKYIASTAGGGATITATASGAMNYPTITVDEFANVHTLDVADTGNASSGNSPVSHAITTTQSGELIVGFITYDCCGGSLTAGTGYTLGGSASTASYNEYLTQASAGATTATAAMGGSSNWFAHVVAFKP